MIRRTLTRNGYWLAVAGLALAVAALAGFDLLVVIPEAASRGPVAVAPTSTPGPTSSASLMPVRPQASSPMGVAMSADADCSACHLIGGGVGTKPIPTMAHPLEGWRDCTACHATGRLVQTAPGHTGIHKGECLVCHKVQAATASALPRPHHVFTNATCISCHGTKAPLPTDMQGRQNCWICHPGTEYESLFGGPAPSASLKPAN